MSPALFSTIILVGSLVGFVSGRVRHDLVALAALFACLLAGLTTPADALAGFADPAVIAVAAILVVGRAVELSGVAGEAARILIPARAGFTVRLSALLVVAAMLSAFMNNIAALVITMPVANAIARDAKRAPGSTLMPLAFATILGGMTTLIGTPANLILSSVREKELGAPLGFFTMAPVGVAVTIVGLLYLAFIGWRLLPERQTATKHARPPWRIYELTAPDVGDALALSTVRTQLRAAETRLLAVFRADVAIPTATLARLVGDDRLLILSRADQQTVSAATGLITAIPPPLPGMVTARAVVAYGSFLIGLSHEAIRIHSNETLHVVAVGPRAARLRRPLHLLRIEAGDQLFIRGTPHDLAAFVGGARLLETDRFDPLPVARGAAIATLGIFAVSVAAVVAGAVPPALAFLGAAAIIAAARLLPAREIYRSIDWSVIVLLAAMIPVGQSFETSGAAAIAAEWLGNALQGLPLVVALAALCTLTMVLSIFLNNVATAIIVGPLAIGLARLLGVAPDAMLLAVLIGASADFLTPIGHQNNLLVMGPGGYRFTDYARMGWLLVVLVISTASLTLAWFYG